MKMNQDIYDILKELESRIEEAKKQDDYEVQEILESFYEWLIDRIQ